MAKNFLEKSPTYVAKTSEDIRKRRAVLCKYMNESYKMPRGSEEKIFKQVREELEPQGIKVTKAIFHSDKTVLRSAFRYLTAKSSAEREQILKTAGSYATGIRHLLKDGVQSFADLRQSEKEKVKEEEALQPLEELRKLFEVVNLAIARILKKQDELSQENRNLREANGSLEEQVSVLNKSLAGTRELLQRAHAERLESIVGQYSDFTGIQGLIDKLKAPEPPASSISPSELELLKSAFPDKMPFQSKAGSKVGKIFYDESFWHALYKFPSHDIVRVKKAVLFVGAHNENHKSLQSSKLYGSSVPHTPVGAFKSRASDEIRITWTRNGDNTVFHWAYRRGDVPGQSEA